MKSIGRLHVITDTSMQTRFTHVEIARHAIAGGADVIQLRDKTMSFSEMIETARVIRKMCHDAGVTFIVNDRADVVLAVDADGVHLGADDLPVTAARAILGPRRLIGGSAPTTSMARDAYENGANYIGVGHVFATSSKFKTTPPIGEVGVGTVAEASPIPVIAIGGITAINVADVIEKGAHGVAVIGAVCNAPDPENATRELRMAIDRRLS